VRYLHFVDRTAIPWQAKDIGRDTLVGYHNGKTLAGLPFAGERRNALYRKLEDNVAEMARLRAAPVAEGRGADAGLAAGRKEKIICWQSSAAAV
jgi:hypothetical protein